MQGSGTETKGRRSIYRYLGIAGAGALVLFIVLAAFLVWLYFQPVGTGEFRSSPDGRYEASVMDFTQESLFGDEAKRWFEFRVEGPGLTYVLTREPLPGPYFGSRSSMRIIFWEPDSSAVRFVFPSAELRVATRPSVSGE